MTFEEAIRKSVKAYFKEVQPENLLGAMKNSKNGKKKLKYNKKYFDNMSEEYGLPSPKV